MHIHRMIITVYDNEETSLKDTIAEIENCRYYGVSVQKVESVLNESWDDDHPMNKKMTEREYNAWWDRKLMVGQGGT